MTTIINFNSVPGSMIVDNSQSSFMGANKVKNPADIRGLEFSGDKTRSFKVEMSVVVIADMSLYSHFEIRGVYHGNNWSLHSSYVGDLSPVTFSITKDGQIQYTSEDSPGFTSLNMNFSVFTISI